MQKQVDKSHYQFSRYVDKRRWASTWNQLDEVLSLKPRKVLEIGPGPGIFKAVAQAFGVRVETLDIDPELHPDYVGAAENMPFQDSSYDVVCAFQMLEHVPYETSITIFQEMARVATYYVVISLPDAGRAWPYSLHIPMKAGDIKFFIPLPRFRLKKHTFDGKHYWEINKKQFGLRKVTRNLTMAGSVELLKTYRIVENPYHRMLVFRR